MHPTVNTFRLFSLKSAFTPQSECTNWAKGRPRAIPQRPSAHSHLFPRLLASGCPVSHGHSAQTPARAKTWTSPVFGSALLASDLPAQGRGELCPTTRWQSRRLRSRTREPRRVPRALFTPNLTPGKRKSHYAGISAHLHAAYTAVKATALGSSALRYPRPPVSPPAPCSLWPDPPSSTLSFVRFGSYSSSLRPGEKTWGSRAKTIKRSLPQRALSQSLAQGALRTSVPIARGLGGGAGSECRLGPDTARHFWWKPQRLLCKGHERNEKGETMTF